MDHVGARCGGLPYPAKLLSSRMSGAKVWNENVEGPSMLDMQSRDDAPGMGRLAHAPADHPPMVASKVGVLLVNLGTPDGTDYWSMRRYLNEFLSDKRVIDYPAWLWQPLLQLVILSKRPFSSGEAYRGIWNTERDESPLRTITRDQTAKVAERMAARHGENVVVDFAMRYGNPSTESVIRKLKDEGCERIVFFPLYPQYSATTTGTACDAAFKALMKMNWQPAIRTVPHYADHPLYIEALAQSVERAYAGFDKRPDALVTSYHGLPIRYLKEGDPYHCLCAKTSRLMQERLGFPKDEVVLTFQSRFGPEEWLQPYTVEKVAELARAGKKHIAVMAPAFSADCVETLEEINEEIKESFEEAGGERFDYIPCLNDDDAHIDMMMAILENEMRGWA
jgi:ferrochelatase